MMDLAENNELLERRLQVVVGKGGVGRTVLASALALRSARAGVRTLLLEVNAPDCAARVLHARPAVDEPRLVEDNLWLCRMTPSGAMREYALMVLKFKALYHIVFENRLVKYLLRSIPGLGEFNMMGKVWFHFTETLDSGEPRYERIIVDAPATGHALTFLSCARVVADSVPDGVMKHAAEKMAQMVEDPKQACLHIVSLPEDMAVNEALELAKASKDRLRMSLGLGIINRVYAHRIQQADAELLSGLFNSEAPGLAPYQFAARRRLSWESLQHEFTERLRAEGGMPTIVVSELRSNQRSATFLDELIVELDSALAVTPAASLATPEAPRREEVEA